MALRQNTAPVVESPSASLFEGQDQPAVDQTTDVAPAKTTAVAKAMPFQAAFQDKREVMSLEDVSALGFGVFDRITADLGGLLIGDREVGKSMKIEMISWNIRYMVVPGSQDAEAKSKVKVSYDNVTLDNDGGSVKDYLASLQAEGYTKATVKTYADIWATMLSNEKDGEIAAEKQQMIQVQLSPESLKQFKRFQIEAGLRASKGIEPPTVFTITAERGEFNGNRFGFMKFS